MRNLILPLLMTSATFATANTMSVVVYTSDRVVVDYVCSERLALGQRNAVRQVVQATGRFDWHVVNGKAPYQVIEQYKDQDGNVCITVMDALGNVASGCGVIGERHMVARVSYPALNTDQQPVRTATFANPTPKATPTDRALASVREASPVRIPNERKPDTSPRSVTPTRVVTRKAPAPKAVRSEPVLKPVRR